MPVKGVSDAAHMAQAGPVSKSRRDHLLDCLSRQRNCLDILLTATDRLILIGGQGRRNTNGAGRGDHPITRSNMSTARQAAEQSKVTLGLADRFSRPSDRDYFLDPPSSYSRYARRGSDPATGSETDPLSRYIRLDVQISRLMDEDTLAPHTLRQRLFSIQPGRVNTRTRPYNSMITRLETILGPGMLTFNHPARDSLDVND